VVGCGTAAEGPPGRPLDAIGRLFGLSGGRFGGLLLGHLVGLRRRFSRRLGLGRLGLGRRLGLGGRLGVGERLRGHQPPQVAKAVETNEHLAQQALGRGRLTARLQHTDRHVADGLLDIRQRERRLFALLAGNGLLERVALQIELEHPADLVACLVQYCRREAKTGTDATEHAGDEQGRAATVQQEHGATIARQHRAHREQRVAQRGRLTATVVARRRAEHPCEGQIRRRRTAEHERRREVSERRVLDRPLDRQLAEHEAYA
jgi:hypothetical protein